MTIVFKCAECDHLSHDDYPICGNCVERLKMQLKELEHCLTKADEAINSLEDDVKSLSEEVERLRRERNR